MRKIQQMLESAAKTNCWKKSMGQVASVEAQGQLMFRVVTLHPFASADPDQTIEFFQVCFLMQEIKHVPSSIHLFDHMDIAVFSAYS